MKFAHRKTPVDAPRRSAPDLAAFQPIVKLARRKVDELIERGAVVIDVRSAQVTLRRGEQTARVDAWGRVDWAH